MDYQYTENSDGTLTLRDYRVMAPLSKGEKGLTEDIGEAWFTEALAKKQPVYLFDGHNEMDADGKVTRYAPIVGRAEPDQLYFDGEVLRAREAKVTDPGFVERFKRSAVGRQSAEFFAKARRILGVALIGGIPGHQDDKIPEARLAGLAAEYKDQLAALAANEQLSTGDVPAKELTMTPEEIKALVNDAVKQAVGEAVKALSAAGDDAFSNNFNDQLKAKIAERDKTRDLDECRKRHILALSMKEKALWSESALTEHFSKCETTREIESEFKRLSLINSKAEADLAVQDDRDLQSGDYQLRTEARKIYARRKGEDEFKRLYSDEEGFVQAHVEANKVLA
jgi:hypothetical protein